MQDILITACGFFVMIFIGYLMKRKGVISLQDKDFLGTMLLNVCLPSVIINSFKDFTFDVSFLIAFAIGVACNLAGIFVGYLLSLKSKREDKALLMVLTSGYNIGIFTIPFVSSFFSATAVLSVLMFDVGNAIFVMGTSAAIISGILENEKGNPFPVIFDKMRKSLCIWAYIIMFTFVALGVQVPEAVFSIVSIPAGATSFLAMTMVGIMLEFKIEPNERKELTKLLFLRYSFAFMIATILFVFLPFELEIKKALMIGVFSPMSTASMVFAQKLGCKSSLVGGAGTFSILLSMIFIVCISLI